MKKILITIFTLFIAGTLYSQEWVYHPVEGSSFYVKDFISYTDSSFILVKDYYTVIEYFPGSDSYKELFTVKSGKKHYTLDDDKKNLWFMNNADISSFNLKTGERIEYDSLIREEDRERLWKSANAWALTPGPGSRATLTNARHLYFLSPDTAEYHYVPDYLGLDSTLFWGNRLLFKDNHAVFLDMVYKNQLVYMDLENPSDNIIQKLPDYIKDEGLSPSEIEFIGDDILCLFQKLVGMALPEYSYICTANETEFRKIEIPYIDSVEAEYCLIADFEAVNSDLIAISLNIGKGKDADIENRLIFIDRTGELRYEANLPKLLPDGPYSNNKGTEVQFNNAHELRVMGNSIYMVASGGDHLGVMEFKLPDILGIEAETEILHIPTIDIVKIYPNPGSSNVSLVFRCKQEDVQKLKVELYDYLGRSYDNFSYEVSEYNPAIYEGTININISSIPAGPKYIMLKNSEESEAIGIMVK